MVESTAAPPSETTLFSFRSENTLETKVEAGYIGNSFDDEVQEIKARANSVSSFKVTFDDENLFKNGRGDFTDVVIRCQDEEWHAHRVILARGCEFFKACFNSSCRETQSGIATMDEDDPFTCKILIEFLYTGKVEILDKTHRCSSIIAAHDTCPHRFASEELNAQHIVSIWNIADKYGVPELQAKILHVMRFPPRFSLDRQIHRKALLEILVGINCVEQSPMSVVLDEFVLQDFVDARPCEGVLCRNNLEFLEPHGDLACRIIATLVNEIDRKDAESNQKHRWTCSGCGYDRFTYT